MNCIRPVENANITECQVFITRKCNIHCGYCKLTKRSFEKELTIDEWKTAFKNMENVGIRTVKILGGEPTVLDHFEDLLVYINENTNLRYAVLSNSMFGEEKFQKLVNAKIQGYFASIDGIEDIKSVDQHGVAKSHAGFEKLIRFKKAGIGLIGANVVISPKNLNDLPEIVRVLSEKGIWVNLCSVIHSDEGEWEFRTSVPDDLKFKDSDIEKINNIMIKLLQMKHEGAKIAMADSYLINMSKYCIKNNWKCTYPVQLRVDADGALMLCNDIRGNVADKYNILNLTKKVYDDFLADWKEEIKQRNCPGCYWSCFLNAQDNLKNGRLEFDYAKQDHI